MKLNDVASFHGPIVSPFSLQKSQYAVGKTAFALGMAQSYACADCQARTDVTTEGQAHCCPTECRMDKFPLLSCGEIWARILNPIPDLFETCQDLFLPLSPSMYV